ncbi:class I SAM-dependent methyltransferase [Streptomyces parvus]|uniref:class I SAM-dependent methyltransferase n=1 Tax=Streptomyces TaxID=1883 RepID=UPI001EF8E935|nr:MULTISPECIES: class I SAM-dependent methyltransferase [unclassified Streptomyces]
MTVYEEDFARVYDDIYRRHKNYAGEADRIRELALEYRPDASSLLDVGCGTGEHLARLRQHFDVAGVDLAPPMIRIATAKLPGVPLLQDDMRTFSLDRTFDVVCSMYSSVGYLATADDLSTAVKNMTGHLRPGGVLIVEPWILREDWNGGDLVQADFENEEGKVVRMGRWTTRNGRSRVEMHYLVATDSGPVGHFVDEQELSLFSREEYEAAFRSAGCAVEYRPDGYADRGIFVGVRQD